MRSPEKPVDVILRRLREMDLDYRPVAPEGRWKAVCPGHQDKTPSLSIREAEDGRALVYCFGPCDTQDVLAAMGLSLGDLFPHDRERGYVKVCPTCKRALP